MLYNAPMGMKSNKIVLLSGVLCEDKGRYLLVQEAQDKPYSKCKDKWTIPHGSYDTEGESISDLAQRELLEETGGQAKLDGRIATIEGWNRVDNSVFLVCVTWYANKWEKIQERWSDEIKEIRFFSEAEIQELAGGGQIRDNIPVQEIITSFETNSSKIVRWNLDIG